MENGVYAAALTPLHPDLSCNDELLTEHCLQLIERGCKGVVLFGTTGEGPSFSVKEKKATLRKVIAQGLNPSKIIFSAGSNCFLDTVDLALTAVELHCAACLIAPPCFFKNVTDEGVISFYREVIQRIADPKVQIILYHIPKYTGVPITPHIVKTLCSEFPGVVIGVKDSEGNLSLIQEILSIVPQFKVFEGKEKCIPEAIRLGTTGVISGKANVWPELVCSLYEKGNSPEIEKALSTIDNLPFVSSCKALLSENNPHWRLVRPPLVPKKD